MDKALPSRLEWRNENQCHLPVLTSKSLSSTENIANIMNSRWTGMYLHALSGVFSVQSDLSLICINSPSVPFIHAQAPEQVFDIADHGADAKLIDFLSKHSDGATSAEFTEDFWLQLCCSRGRCYCTYLHPEHILLVTRSPRVTTATDKTACDSASTLFHLRCLGESAFFKEGECCWFWVFFLSFPTKFI